MREYYGWKSACGLLAVAGLLSCSIVVVSAKDRPADPPKKSAAESTQEKAAINTVAQATLETSTPEKTAKPDGRELFTREWLPKDSRAHGGDGLGPVFNDTSCVACHNQGGAGGAGPASKNVDIVTAFSNGFNQQQHGFVRSNSVPEAMFSALFGGFGIDHGVQPVAPQSTAQNPTALNEADKKALVKKEREALTKIHPGFLSARSVVLHKSGIDDKYASWRGQMQGQGHLFGHNPFAMEPTLQHGHVPAAFEQELEQPAVVEAVVEAAADLPTADAEVVSAIGVDAAVADVATLNQVGLVTVESTKAQQMIQQHRNQLQHFTGFGQGTQGTIGNFTFLGSQRNPTALFGAGAIDAVPEEVIRENAKRKHADFPEIAGRVSKLKDGRIGRFGWKNQTASLKDFAVTACAVELGLDVPGHAQAGVPHDSKYKSTGHDMNKAEVEALVKYLRDLPVPEQIKPTSKQQGEYLSAGAKHFASVGCIACHTQDLGPAKGVYSDLLIHDMGQDLGDTGAYGIFIPNSPEEGADEPLPSLASSQPRGNGKPTAAELAKTIGALRQEWRTPPLWGVRDSGPYLHDGRADTLEQAIALHGGTAARSSQKFFELKREEQMQVLSFLRSLSAPDQPQLAGK